MNRKLLIPPIRSVLFAGLIAGCVSANATVIYSDNYNVANTNLDAASLSGRTNGIDAYGVLPKSTTIVQQIKNNQLQLIPGGGDQTGDSACMRFNTITNSAKLWDWSNNTGGAAITNAGGMTVTFNWTAGNTNSTDWLFFAAGADSNDVYGINYKLLITSTNTASGIVIANNGQVQTYSGGVLYSSGAFIPTTTNHVVKLDYEFTSWAIGAPVNVSVIVDSNYVASGTFTWAHNLGGQFFNLGTYQETNYVDNFTVTTYTNTISSGFNSLNFTNNGTLPWGAHTDNGSEYYTVTNSYGQPCVTISNNVLTLNSYYIVQNGCNYQSGVVWAGAQVPSGGYNFVTLDADIYTPYAGTTGCWPAFWLDSAWTWPPEIDIAEFKGNQGGGNVWQNVDNTGGTWVCVISTVTPSLWHHYALALAPANGGNRFYQLYCDGVIKGTGSFTDTQGVPFSIIFNYAMEGSSGTPGPTTTTYIQVKNWKMALH
jgi:hypothetical protein